MPKSLIQRPCPYIDRLESVMDGDHCRMCRRDVHDLTGMSDAERTAFLASCSTTPCVRYTLDVKPAVAAAMIAAAVAAAVTPAMAAPRQPTHHVAHRPPTIAMETVQVVTAGVPPPVEQPPEVRPPADREMPPPVKPDPAPSHSGSAEN